MPKLIGNRRNIIKTKKHIVLVEDNFQLSKGDFFIWYSTFHDEYFISECIDMKLNTEGRAPIYIIHGEKGGEFSVDSTNFFKIKKVIKILK